LLRHAFPDLLPPDISTRSKQGFSVPIGMWLRTTLRSWSRERLLDNRALDGWFQPAAVSRLLEEHERGVENHGKRIWALLMFAVWLDLQTSNRR
jgi:asparagine synthase (glutamine-hydrolysing)